MEKRLTFRYGRALILSRVILWGIVAALLLTVVGLAPEVPMVPVALFAGLLVLAFFLFAVTPVFTEHWLTRSRLILRQGWYFRLILPLSEVTWIGPADETRPLRVPLGIHRPFGQPTLYVTAGRTNLFIARLAEPRRIWQALGLPASEIVFDVEDRARFLKALEERRRLFPPVEPDRPGTALRD